MPGKAAAQNRGVLRAHVGFKLDGLVYTQRFLGGAILSLVVNHKP